MYLRTHPRYFVVRALDEASQQHAFVGIGFTERTDAFDFNVALADHFKHEKASEDAAKAADEPYVAKHETGGLSGPIKINLKGKSGTKEKKADDGGFAGLQAPPGLWGSAGPPKVAFNLTRSTLLPLTRKLSSGCDCSGCSSNQQPVWGQQSFRSGTGGFD